MPAADVDDAMTRLRADIESGAWAEMTADILAVDELDLGYRIVVSERL